MINKIRVFIADDQDIARQGMERILLSQEDFEIIGSAAVLPDVIQQVQVLHPDILLLDLQWLGDERAGIDAIKRLSQDAPDVKIIAITVYSHLIEPARNAGAQAAVNKDIPMKQLIEEIKGIYLLPPISDKTRNMPNIQGNSPRKLSPKEMDVLMLLAEGKSDKEICSSLSISESTVKSHVSNIIRKLDAANRAGAVAVGYQEGLIGHRKL